MVPFEWLAELKILPVITFVSLPIWLVRARGPPKRLSLCSIPVANVQRSIMEKDSCICHWHLLRKSCC